MFRIIIFLFLLCGLVSLYFVPIQIIFPKKVTEIRFVHKFNCLLKILIELPKLIKSENN